MSSFALPYAPSETLGFSARLERLDCNHGSSGRGEEGARRLDADRPPRQDRLSTNGRRFCTRRPTDDRRRDLPHLFDDEADRLGRDNDAGGGRTTLITDPISKYIPAFANVKVGVANGDKLDLAPPKRPITVQDLMRHTSGLTYGFAGASPVQKLVKAANVADPNRTSAENIEALAALSLMYQPGEVWEYGLSTDVLGRIVEIVEGAPLGDVLQRRLFGPLDMVDTAFFTPEFETQPTR